MEQLVSIFSGGMFIMRSLAAIAALFLAMFLSGCGLLPEVKDETVGWSANKLYTTAKESLNESRNNFV